MIYSLGLVFIAVILTGISQVLLKIGSQHAKENERSLSEYFNVHTVGAYGLLLMVTVISVIALREIPLKMFYAIASLNFVVVLFLSWAVLKEEVNKNMIIGILLIVGGLVIFNMV